MVAVAAAGNHVWIANLYPYGDGGPVTELDATNGGWIRTLTGSTWIRSLLDGCLPGIVSTGRYRFVNPSLAAASDPASGSSRAAVSRY
ncbi:MAG: hypothetical protein ACR2MP_09965 [Streptosporangiaceae bacterium]